ncbi:TPT-domain-containing protein [Ascodesmis nigricans]|uniref:TPT-domain-containing protein n=1 Tax=Ascodesmis nigricans TaxID=341454 RepID=A0A4V3SHZ3_9PEZI|nr:TPT-domain-containing protein [Ascodesmis nigricans]
MSASLPHSVPGPSISSSSSSLSASLGNNGHVRRTSLGDAIRAGRRRAQSVSAHDVVDTLKAPVSWKLISMCLLWYLCSALSNTSSKSILNAFPRPVTLTLIQFLFVFLYCVLLFSLARHLPPAISSTLRPPSRATLLTTAPLGIFQVGGHITSSIATSLIAVSLVHTIKGMSPLFTVAAYRTLFGVQYSTATYISLIPLTIGVFLACSAEFRGHFFGIIMAFTGALIFVTQNIWSKKLFTQSSDPKKLDKMNLLIYSAGQAFIMTLPLWLYTEAGPLFQEYIATGGISLAAKSTLSGWGLIWEIVFNGTVHFMQNVLAFLLLAMVSPVTYSIASLVKRIFVIVMAIVWFGSPTTVGQAVGILLTFLGLYLYDRAGDSKRHHKRTLGAVTEENALDAAAAAARDPLLPVTEAWAKRRESFGEPGEAVEMAVRGDGEGRGLRVRSDTLGGGR